MPASSSFSSFPRRSPSPGRRRFLLARCRFPRFPPLLSSFPVVSYLVSYLLPSFLPSSHRFPLPILVVYPSSSCNFPPLPLSFPLSWLSSFPPSLSFPPFPLLLSSFPPPIVPPSSFGPPPLVIFLITLHLRFQSFALAVLVVLGVLVVRPPPLHPCRSPGRPRRPRHPLVVLVFRLRCPSSSVERSYTAHIPLERGGAGAAVVRATHPGALVVEPTSLRRGEGLMAGLWRVVGREWRCRGGRWWWWNEPTSTVMRLMLV